jgi:putative transcriptional regulator
MHDRFFERAVVLLCQHDENGTLGLVINRDGNVTLGEVVERLDLGLPQNADTPTWWGGPVGAGTGFVIWKGAVDPDEGWNLGKQVAVSPSAQWLGQLVAGRRPFHLCLGYAGWGPGQLDTEIESGSWLVADIDPGVIFETSLAERYTRALALLGLTPETVWMKPIDE